MYITIMFTTVRNQFLSLIFNFMIITILDRIEYELDIN